jgi:hypothetical protein
LDVINTIIEGGMGPVKIVTCITKHRAITYR